MSWFSGIGHALSNGVKSFDHLATKLDPLTHFNSWATANTLGKIPGIGPKIDNLQGKLANHPLEGFASAATLYMAMSGLAEAGGIGAVGEGGAAAGGAAGGGAGAAGSSGGWLSNLNNGFKLFSAGNSLLGNSSGNKSSGPSGAGGNMDLGSIGSIVGLAGGVNSLFNKSGSGTLSPSVVNTANPMAPYQANLASMYNGYLTGGNNMDATQMPGYSQFTNDVVNPAMDATARKDAAMGLNLSPNQTVDMEKTAQQGYYGFMQNYLSQLAGGAGVGANTGTAAQLGVGSANSSQQGIMQGLGGLTQSLGGSGGNWLSSLFSSGGGGTGAGSGLTSMAGSDGSYLDAGSSLWSAYTGG